LAGLAVVPARLVADFEAGAVTLNDEEQDAIQDALEHADVEFVEGGVRLRNARR
jgi:hypothetical protein